MRCVVSILDILPVYYLPYVVNVMRANILVVPPVGVLPNIDRYD